MRLERYFRSALDMMSMVIVIGTRSIVRCNMHKETPSPLVAAIVEPSGHRLHSVTGLITASAQA
jgi:hypothetical protein